MTPSNPAGRHEPQTRTLDVPGATITYDVRGPLPPAAGGSPLLLIGQPMDAEGFTTLADLLADAGCTVVTYDPRGLGRSTRSDGSQVNDPALQAEDLHALVAELDAGPVDVFASSGGAVTALAWVAAHPGDLSTVVGHEPPLLTVLPDAERARAAFDAVSGAYHARGWGHGMAAFIAMTMWPGELTDEYAAQPLPDPAMFGMPTDDDGNRADPLLSGVSDPVIDHVVDAAAITAAATRVVIGVGAETGESITGRASRATAEVLGVELVEFPGGHGGFMGGEDGQTGPPDEFAATLRRVLG